MHNFSNARNNFSILLVTTLPSETILANDSIKIFIWNHNLNIVSDMVAIIPITFSLDLQTTMSGRAGKLARSYTIRTFVFWFRNIWGLKNNFAPFYH